LGAEKVEAPSVTEIFESVFPYYLAMGMTYEQFWLDDPLLVKAYRKADEIRKRRMNEELWLNGIYMTEALASTVGNMFSKGQKHQYPSEPKPITREEVEERRIREQKAKEERIKAKFTARALAINANKGV
jgi:hypothetical protein